MAKKKFLVNIDLNKNQILNTILQILASDPSAVADDKGWVYYNSTSKQVKYFNGTEWKYMGSVQSIIKDSTTPITVSTDSEGVVKIGILESTSSQDGYMSKEAKAKLDGIEEHAKDDQEANEVNLNNTTGMNHPADGDVESVLKALDSALNSSDTDISTLSSDFDDHINDRNAPSHKASAISTVAYGDFFGSNVQAALQQLKDYVAGVKDSSLKAPEAFDPTPGTYPADFGGNAIQKGDSYRITKTGTIGTRSVNTEDLLIALIDNPDQVDANWLVVEGNRDQATTDFLGLVKLATQAQAEAGTNDTAAMTPLKVKQFFESQLPSIHYNSTITGDGTATLFTITHNLNINSGTIPNVVFEDADTGEIVELYYEKNSSDTLNKIDVVVNSPIANGKVYNLTVYAG